MPAVLEWAADRLPVLLTVPPMMFILPALFIVIASRWRCRHRLGRAVDDRR